MYFVHLKGKKRTRVDVSFGHSNSFPFNLKLNSTVVFTERVINDDSSSSNLFEAGSPMDICVILFFRDSLLSATFSMSIF